MKNALVKIERKERDCEIIDLEQCRQLLYRSSNVKLRPKYRTGISRVKILTLDDLFVMSMDEDTFNQFNRLKSFSKIAVWHKFKESCSTCETVNFQNLIKRIIKCYSKD